MNKNLIIGAVVLLVLGGAGWYFLKGQNKSSQNVGTNAITSIKDALSKSVSLECDYKDENGQGSKSYIKNGAVRVDVISDDPEKAASIIMKDKKMYSWTGKKEVCVMELPDEAVEKPVGSVNEGSTQQANLMADLEKYKDACKAAIVSDSLFTPPADVKFTDLSQMMKGSTEKYMQQSAESGN